jgi:hypothetical protein
MCATKIGMRADVDVTEARNQLRTRGSVLLTQPHSNRAALSVSGGSIRRQSASSGCRLGLYRLLRRRVDPGFGHCLNGHK